jgi:hypothetical protein
MGMESHYKEGPVVTRLTQTLRPVMRHFIKGASVRFPRLFVARSEIHGLALFAGEAIEWG